MSLLTEKQFQERVVKRHCRQSFYLGKETRIIATLRHIFVRGLEPYYAAPETGCKESQLYSKLKEMKKSDPFVVEFLDGLKKASST